MDALVLLVKLPVVLAIVFVIYVLPIVLFIVCIIRLVFNLGTRKWLILAGVFSLPLSVLVLTTKVKPFTLTTDNAAVYGSAALTLAAAVFWFIAAVKPRKGKYWLEAVTLALTSIFWITYMITTTKWIVG